jgi:hypothetical protein
MKSKSKVDILSKMIDGLYKKLVVLLAIAGGFGAYSIKFLLSSYWLGYIFIVIFAFVCVAIFGAYVKLNNYIKRLERITDG